MVATIIFFITILNILIFFLWKLSSAIQDERKLLCSPGHYPHRFLSVIEYFHASDLCFCNPIGYCWYLSVYYQNCTSPVASESNKCKICRSQLNFRNPMPVSVPLQRHMAISKASHITDSFLPLNQLAGKGLLGGNWTKSKTSIATLYILSGYWS